MLCIFKFNKWLILWGKNKVWVFIFIKCFGWFFKIFKLINFLVIVWVVNKWIFKYFIFGLIWVI